MLQEPDAEMEEWEQEGFRPKLLIVPGTTHSLAGLDQRQEVHSMQTTTIPNVRQLPRVPKPGELYLSINLAMADPGQVWILARQLGFTPELAYLPTTAGIEIHALLHHEIRQLSSLLDTNEFDDPIESLMEAGINPEVIRFVYGKDRTNAT